MTACQRRWRWPGGLGARVGLLVVGVILVAQLVTGVYYGRQQLRELLALMATATADRAVVMTGLLEEADSARQALLLRAIRSPLLSATLDPHPPRWPDAWRHNAWVREAASARLMSLGERPVQVRLFRTPQGSRGVLLGRFRLGVAVALAQGEWLVLEASADAALPPWRGPGLLIFWLTVILALALWTTHRLTRPLRALAVAADRLGVDLEAAPLPEHGSRELRATSRAFNRMQRRLQRLLEERTRLLAAMAHDLRSALTRLRLRVDHINDPEQHRRALADMAAMSTMVNGALAFARDEAASEPRTRMDLAVLLQTLCDDLEDSGQRVSFSGPEHLPMLARPVALQRLFANLLDNACRHGGGAEVHLAQDDHGLQVTIGDQGPGIPPADRERVFAPFVRLDDARTLDTGGTGLGLAVARGVARLHGGEISLEDRPGGGLLVVVALPLDK